MRLNFQNNPKVLLVFMRTKLLKTEFIDATCTEIHGEIQKQNTPALFFSTRVDGGRWNFEVPGSSRFYMKNLVSNSKYKFS